MEVRKGGERVGFRLLGLYRNDDFEVGGKRNRFFAGVDYRESETENRIAVRLGSDPGPGSTSTGWGRG